MMGPEQHRAEWAAAEVDDLTAAIADLLAAIPVTATSNAERPCEHCGGEVTGRADRRYCSGACRVAAHRKRHRAPRPRAERTCAWCGYRLGSWKRPDAKFCDNACKQAEYRGRVALTEFMLTASEEDLAAFVKVAQAMAHTEAG